MSEAISGAVLGGPRMSLRSSGLRLLTRFRDLAALIARGLHLSLALFEIEGAGKTGCLLHPRSRVRFALNKVHTSIQGSGSIPAFPAQWLYGLLRALPGERLFCLRRQRDRSRQLNASTAAPEPHDFTVRFRHVRLAPFTSIASHRAFVTMANAPHLPRDGRSYGTDLGENESGIFLRARLDTTSG
ncbi:hypothetical protein V1283_004051 [Bradyrhizobium sp. AZCC 2262]